ncbi:MAG: allantoate amidohydrolase [Actinomycetota bacterium]|jgi:allantoate deiminase|nr:allantoate amidohydrolase [Rubrobacter sp.]MDQ3506424.1 allantoate amidohydrolase [Actinomycetota bacterium]
MNDAAAKTVMERCEFLSSISEDEEGICRPYGCESMREVNGVVSGWMHSAGMTTKYDAIGNLIGRYEGEGEETLILGSHLDTVRDAGKYDGILGVMVAIACVEKLVGGRLPFSIEVAAFADEEGLRFGTTYLGSSVYAGVFDDERLKLEDRDGVSLARAVRDFGGNPDAMVDGGIKADGLLGYCEVHIEQGPVLENRDLPVGVVTGIQSQSRVQASFTGVAGHAGTVPMEGRKDALCATAEFILEVERMAKDEPDAVATVGEMKALPGASNVISGEARVSLDLRHPDDEVRERLRDHLEARAADIAAARNCGHSWEVRQENIAVPMDERLTGLLVKAMESSGLPVCRIPSGAGHDAAQMAVLTAPAVLFVRCEDGISHNPAESVTEGDVAVAIDVIDRFIELVAEMRNPT